jgi:hypothetical protein
MKLSNGFFSKIVILPPPLETVAQLGKGAEDSEKRNRQAGEKALDLPARSRFGEGRAEPLDNSIRTLQGLKRIAFPRQELLLLRLYVRILKLCLPAGRQGTRLFVPSIQALPILYDTIS